MKKKKVDFFSTYAMTLIKTSNLADFKYAIIVAIPILAMKIQSSKFGLKLLTQNFVSMSFNDVVCLLSNNT